MQMYINVMLHASAQPTVMHLHSSSAGRLCSLKKLNALCLAQKMGIVSVRVSVQLDAAPAKQLKGLPRSANKHLTVNMRLSASDIVSNSQDSTVQHLGPSKLCVTCWAAAAVPGMNPCARAQASHPPESLKPTQKLGVVVERSEVGEQQLGVGQQLMGVAKQQQGVAREQQHLGLAVQAWRFAPVTGGPTALAWPHLHLVWCLLEHIHAVRSLHHCLEADSCRPDVTSEHYPTVGAGGLQVGEG